MHRKERESLKLDALFALIDSFGEIGSTKKRQKLSTRPSTAQLKSQYANTGWYMQQLRTSPILKDKLEELFNHLPQLALPQYALNPCLETHEFFEIKSFLWVYNRLRTLMIDCGGEKLHSLPDLDRLFRLLDPDGNGIPAFRISPLYDKKLLHLTEKRLDSAHKLKAEKATTLAKAKAKLNNPNLKEEFILPRSQTESIDRIQQSSFFVVVSESMANLSVRLADSLKALHHKNEIKLLNQEIEVIERKIRTKLTTELFKHFIKLETAYQSCAELAWEYSLADFALKHDCCIPRLSGKYDKLRIKKAVNLPLKLLQESQNRQYQSLDLDFGQNANLLTGPNMGGKSTALITLGQLCHLAAWGIPLPAEEAELPVFDEVYYNHDSGERSENLSSFGREVVSLVQMLSRKGHKLILLDEFARGTNPEEGEALCLAVLRHLKQSGQTFVAATHFSAPTRLQGLAHYSIKGISDKALSELEGKGKAVLEERLKHLSEAMDYGLKRLKQNQSPPQCALRIATILGLPDEILSYVDEEKYGEPER